MNGVDEAMIGCVEKDSFESSRSQGVSQAVSRQNVTFYTVKLVAGFPQATWLTHISRLQSARLMETEIKP